MVVGGTVPFKELQVVFSTSTLIKSISNMEELDRKNQCKKDAQMFYEMSFVIP